MVANAMDLPAGKGAKFSDVSADHPYYEAISAMCDMGFLSGHGDGTFVPEDPITFQEAVTVLSEMAAWTSMDGWELDGTPLLPEELLDFYNYDDWARIPARNLSVLEAMVEGFAPQDPITREAAAAMLCRLMESIHLIWD